jgi:hypothetical protein
VNKGCADIVSEIIPQCYNKQHFDKMKNSVRLVSEVGKGRLVILQKYKINNNFQRKEEAAYAVCLALT